MLSKLTIFTSIETFKVPANKIVNRFEIAYVDNKKIKKTSKFRSQANIVISK